MVYGDPRKQNGWLDERYFNEEKDKPICAVNVRNRVVEAKVIVTVRAKFGHLDVIILDDMGATRSQSRYGVCA